MHSCVCLYLIGFKVLVEKLDEIFLWAVVVDLLGVGLLLYGGISIFRLPEPSILEENSSVGKRRQVKLRDVCPFVHMCVLV